MQIIRIGGDFPPELEIYTALKENQLARCREPEPGLFIAESPQIVRMALEAGYRPESFLLEEGSGEKFLKDMYPKCLSAEGTEQKEEEGATEECPETKAADQAGQDICVYIASHEKIRTLAGYELTGGVLAAFQRKPLPAPEEVFRGAKRAVALECVMNPRNVGSIFRSAAAIGFDAVLLTKGASDPLYRRAARVSMGTVFQIPWTFAEDLSVLKDQGFVTVAMALTDCSVSMGDPVLQNHRKLAVVMGSERSGLKEETIRACDYTAKIPMKHGVDSLNVAAASAVAFWELRDR